MYIYMTSGTPEYMKRIKSKYPNEQMYLLHGIGNSLLIHETLGKTAFQVPRKFEVLETYGTFAEKGYFVLQHIPISDEGSPLFESKYTNLSTTVEKEPGCIALRVLKPIKSDTYIILTEWSGPNSFEVWEKAVAFDFTKIADYQKIFNSAPYVTKYKTQEEEEEADNY